MRKRRAGARRTKEGRVQGHRKANRKARMGGHKAKAGRSTGRALRKVLENGGVSELLNRIAGDKAAKIVAKMSRGISDEELADACKMKVSDVRAVLNKLHSFGVADYTRLRDRETGWYSYVWNVWHEKLARIVDATKREEVRKFEEKLNYERAFDFYACKKCGDGARFDFEAAFEMYFRCPVCKENLDFFSNAQLVGELEKKLASLKGTDRWSSFKK